jgi:hypothetical protein
MAENALCHKWSKRRARYCLEYGGLNLKFLTCEITGDCKQEYNKKKRSQKLRSLSLTLDIVAGAKMQECGLSMLYEVPLEW